MENVQNHSRTNVDQELNSHNPLRFGSKCQQRFGRREEREESRTEQNATKGKNWLEVLNEKRLDSPVNSNRLDRNVEDAGVVTSNSPDDVDVIE